MICHGAFDEARGEYYLAIEDNFGLGLKILYESDIKKLLKGISNVSDIKLVIINACYSEKFASAFKDEGGINFVVAVNGKDKINDMIAQEFSNTLYHSFEI